MRSRCVLYVYILIFICLLLRPVAARENSTDVYNSGVELFKQGKIDLAISTFQKAIALNRYYCLAYYGLGKSYLYKKDKMDLAIFHLEKAVRLDSRFAKGYFYLGLAYFFAEKYPKAVWAFEQAYRNDEEMIEALYNIYAVFDIIDQKRGAVFYYRQYQRAKEKRDDDVLF